MFRLQSRIVFAPDGTCVHARHSQLTPGGPACVLIHGSGDGAFVWDGTCRALHGLCPVVTVDLRGHGDSGNSQSGRYDLSVHVEDLSSVINILGIGSVFLVGHSLGGQLALRLAGNLAEPRVLGLVLVDVCPEPNRGCMQQVSSQMKGSLRTYGSVAEYASWLLETRPLLSRDMAAGIAARALRCRDSGFELKLDPRYALESRAGEEMNVEEWSRLTGRISCPTLIVRGSASAMVSARSAEQLLGMLRRGQLRTIQAAGHAVMADNPEAFERVVTGFIAGLMP